MPWKDKKGNIRGQDNTILISSEEYLEDCEKDRIEKFKEIEKIKKILEDLANTQRGNMGNPAPNPR